MIPGFATAEGTARYALRFPEKNDAGFFRLAAGLHLSSLGLGTYLGSAEDATDQAYADAVRTAVSSGINFFDTAINYRHQRSERSIGVALHSVFNAGEAQRDEVVVCTKAGFLTPNAVPDSLKPEDIVGRMHSMAPEFLADQIDRSRANLMIDTLDVFYLHNPETQLRHVSAEVFEARMRRAFAQLEQQVSNKNIRFYGAATWDGFRKANQLGLERLAAIAAEEGGEDHHFRFIQLPFNLGMVEGYTQKPENVLDAAARLGIVAVASASLLQTRAIQEMPDAVVDLLPGLTTHAQRAIQFTRSTPGIAVALVGMSQSAHVTENLGVATVPPAVLEQYLRFYK